MALLHVQELDGENVRGLPKFLGAKEKRRGLMLRGGPPLHHRGDARQLRCSQRAQNTQNVQVRMRVVKIAARRRPVQNDRLEIVLRRFVQPFDEVFQRFLYVAHCVPQTLPTPGGSTASAAASAEAAKSSAAGIATRAAAKAAASPSATHPAQHRSNPPAATATSSAACSSLPGSRNRENNPDDEKYSPKANRRRMTLLFPHRPSWGLARQRNAAIIRNIFRQHPRRGLDRGAVVSPAQQRHHRAARVSSTRVVNHRFQAVPNFNTVFVLVGSNQEQHAAIVALASHPELLVQIHRKVLDALSLQRMHRNHGDLRASLFLDLVAESFQPGLRVWSYHARKVCDISARMYVFRIFSKRRKRRQKQQNARRGRRERAKAFHREISRCVCLDSSST